VVKRFQVYVVYFFCLLILAVNAAAQTVPLWDRWEQTFTSRTPAAPETQFNIELTSPSGRVFTVAGFWTGVRHGACVLCPSRWGHGFIVRISVPVLDGLDGRGGTFVCRQKRGNARFLQHGPVRVSANGRFFQHADGTPFFWMGDTVWYGAILSSKADWNTYLADRVSKGFDVVHCNVVAPRNGVAADENGEVLYEIVTFPI
jgi:hypothetical protein